MEGKDSSTNIERIEKKGVWDWIPNWIFNCFTTSWVQCSAWHPKEWPELAKHLPPRHSDYRDLVPPSMANVAAVSCMHYF